MACKQLEVDPFIIWQRGKNAEHVKMLTGGGLMKPWSDHNVFPLYRYPASYQLGYPHRYPFNKFFEVSFIILNI